LAKRLSPENIKEGLINAQFYVELLFRLKKAIQTQFGHDHPLCVCAFFACFPLFGGKQAHWLYANRYFSPIIRLLKAASNCS